jgi:methyl-accepting chemotaxis protein
MLKILGKKNAAAMDDISGNGTAAAGAEAPDYTDFILELAGQIQKQTDQLIKEEGVSTGNFNSLLNNESDTNEQIQNVQQHLQSVVTSSNQTKELLDEIIGNLEESTAELSEARQKNESMVSEMNHVIEVFAQFNLLFGELQQEYNQIEKLASVISGIANRTKLLSLNASIEAARAGEQGRGFAIVADEIKKLSESTQVNAKSIINSLGSMTTVINRLNDKTMEGAQMMPSTQKMVEASTVVFDNFESLENSLIQNVKAVITSQDDNISEISEINSELLNFIEKAASDNTQYKKLVLGVQKKADYYLLLLHYLKQIDVLREQMGR